ncbi:maleylpyruvate isomerase family mycothiol-dependent enzyme [Kribbella turkmenica]|uniref:Maleylpyruvate isomerase family mycothiol-dependent enzyme n=1 Tax=Kribbella turkmenica TaxID=2530375 RepID=A0A4R4WVR3_9ACTN|nr:maleylpyruvate isomerase family mycothiol-dependent enzyme [Kribbella turkmenica]TDD21774.1 maleylpyruvate isomerase family mycothiol-dependent enzyme [Kribbella turkmenica]
MDRERSWQVIEEQRNSLADLLETLTDAECELPSLCDGWRIKDVAAHVALAPQPPNAWTMLIEAARAGGRFHKLNHDIAVRYADQPVDVLVANLREHATSRRLPRVTNYRNILFDILVHSQDIAIPLGRHHQMPRDAAEAGANRVWSMGWPFWAKHRLRGFRLTATDTDWTVGSGADVQGPIDALLLLLTGRTAVLPRLSGDGVPALTQRTAQTTGQHGDPSDN